jgi:hypothetical protein
MLRVEDKQYNNRCTSNISIIFDNNINAYQLFFYSCNYRSGYRQRRGVVSPIKLRGSLFNLLSQEIWTFHDERFL